MNMLCASFLEFSDPRRREHTSKTTLRPVEDKGPYSVELSVGQ